MNTCIALLRGINVGGANILPMKELTGIFADLGYTDLRTYIQSGNVVCRRPDTPDPDEAGAISSAIAQAKGFAPRVLLLGASDFRAAIDGNPFPTEDGKALHFSFLDAQPDRPDLARLERLRADRERFFLGERVFYLYAPEGIGRSKLAAAVESALGVGATARNWNTVRTLAAMLDDLR